MSDDTENENEAVNDMLARAAEAGADVGDEVEIDLSEAVTYEPFTATVPVEITGAAVKIGKDSGKPYVELKVRVFEGEHEGRILWTNINLTGKGAGYAPDKLAAFGYALDLKAPKVSTSKLVGLRANAGCAPDTREGYERKVVINKLTKYVSAATAEAANLK